MMILRASRRTGTRLAAVTFLAALGTSVGAQTVSTINGTEIDSEALRGDVILLANRSSPNSKTSIFSPVSRKPWNFGTRMKFKRRLNWRQ